MRSTLDVFEFKIKPIKQEVGSCRQSLSVFKGYTIVAVIYTILNLLLVIAVCSR